MIIAALGFAAFENILIFLSPSTFSLSLGKTLALASFRFVSATFLHALCSATVGFFLALSFFEIKKRARLLAIGLGIATLLHGLYNFSITNPDLIYRPFGIIIEKEEKLEFIIPVIILIGLAFFVTFGFQRVKKIKSVCKI